MQGMTLIDPVLAKAARKLGIDQVAIRQNQRARRQGTHRPSQQTGKRAYITGCFVKEALDRGADSSNGRSATSAAEEERHEGARRRRIDELLCRRRRRLRRPFLIKPDGKLYIQSGIGNLGTESMSDAHRVAAEILGVPWEKVEIVWGSAPRMFRGLAPRAAARPFTPCRAPPMPPPWTGRRSCRRSRRRISAASPKTTKSPMNASSTKAAGAA